VKSYEKNYAVDSEAVENILQVDSLVPTANAFPSKLAQFGFCLYLMLIVDLMHELELGVLKTLFIHFLRILDWTDGFEKYLPLGVMEYVKQDQTDPYRRK